MGFYNPPAAGKEIATGTYTGNETARQITVGFKCSQVTIETITGAAGTKKLIFALIPNRTIMVEAAAENAFTKAWLHASDGFELSTNPDPNGSSGTYYYWAISE